MTTNTTNSQAASFRTELLPILRNMYLRLELDAIDDEICSVLDMIEAKLAQAREEGEQYQNLTCQTLKEHNMQLESRLAEIQRGVEGLQGYDKARILVAYADVIALLQPQGQADTSGLPG